MRWADLIDAPKAVRGASTGFTILVLGGLSAPVAVALLPVVGIAWLPLVAVVAFVVAAARIGSAPNPWVHGVVSALSAYLLVLPLVVLGGRPNPAQIAMTAGAAVVVGAVTGLVQGIRRDRRK